MIYVFWILVVIAAVIGGLGTLFFAAGVLGKADPTNHGNLAAIQIGFVGMVIGAVPGVLAALVHWVFL